MSRITEKDLQELCDRINTATKSPMKPYTRVSVGFSERNVGNYNLSFAYGGVALHRMAESGGVIDIFSGHMPKRELYGKMQAYLAGIGA